MTTFLLLTKRTTVVYDFRSRSLPLLQVTDETAKSFLKKRINPTCLPTFEYPMRAYKTHATENGQQAKNGIYSGWSNPPPFHYVESNAPLDCLKGTLKASSLPSVTCILILSSLLRLKVVFAVKFADFD